MLSSLVFAKALLAPHAAGFDPYSYGPYSSGITRPESHLGYEIGKRHSTFREQEAVMQALAKQAPGRVRLIDYGRSVEGRPLRIMVISSETNIANLEQIKADHAKLDAGLDAKQAEALSQNLPAYVWINECIHGNETASFESAMWTAYTFAASNHPDILKTLDKAVIILNPVYNPDGHERFVVYNNSFAIGAPEDFAFEKTEPAGIHGRTNHYRFDMNRDRVAMSQDETRAEVAEMFKWNPQVYVDQHGQTHEYFFPPNPMSINANVDRDRINQWTLIFGKANAGAFDLRGWLYFVRDTFDLYYAGYLDSFVSLNGAIGMTYETDGGRDLANFKEDGTVLTLRMGAEKHFLTAITTAMTAAQNSPALLTSYTQYRRRAISGEFAGKFQRVVLTSADPRPLLRLNNQLQRAGVETKWVTSSFTQNGAHDYWSETLAKVTVPAGSLVVDMNQARGPLAKALLEPGADFEKEFTERQLKLGEAQRAKKQYPASDDIEFYDMTGWSVIYGHGLNAWWCESRPNFDSGAAPTVKQGLSGDRSTVGWVIKYTDRDDVLAATDLSMSGLRLMQARKDMNLGGKAIAAGSFMVLADRNSPDVAAKLGAVAKKRGVEIEAIPTAFPEVGRESPGSGSSTAVIAPSKIGIIFGSDRTTDFSSIWYMFEREYKLPFTPLQTRAVESDIAQYSTIIFPEGRYPAPSDALKQWVERGGCAIIVGNPQWALGTNGFAQFSDKKVSYNKSSVSPLYIPGSIFLGQGYADSFVTFGYPRSGSTFPIAVPVDGTTFRIAKEEGGSVVDFASDAKAVRLLSGWAWPGDSGEGLAGTAMVHDEPVGRGRVVFFMFDPTSRAMWPSFDKMLLNAVLSGPGSKY